MQLKAKTTQTNKQPVTLTDSKPKRPNPEVSEKKPRRRFTAKYKFKILSEIDACTDTGGVGAILRREGLYYSSISTWRRQHREGGLNGLTPQKRGRKKSVVSPEAKRLAELERENRKLAKKLKQAELIIDVQKKISKILEGSQTQDDDEK